MTLHCAEVSRVTYHVFLFLYLYVSEQVAGMHSWEVAGEELTPNN
jgi:hypothetical protein